MSAWPKKKRAPRPRKYSKQHVAMWFEMRRTENLTYTELSQRIGVERMVLHKILSQYAMGLYE